MSEFEGVEGSETAEDFNSEIIKISEFFFHILKNIIHI